MIKNEQTLISPKGYSTMFSHTDFFYYYTVFSYIQFKACDGMQSFIETFL